MNTKPLVYSILILLVVPFPIFNAVSGLDYNTTVTTQYQNFSESNKVEALESGEVFNNLVQDRWKNPMSLGKVKLELDSYENRALISFFSYEERDLFETRALEKGITVEKTYNSIPAITISYAYEDVNQFLFESLKVKYTYPIGTNSFTVPQNIDADFSGLMNLRDIRRALEIDELHSQGYTGYGVNVAILDSGLNASRVPALGKLLNYPTEDKVLVDINLIEAFEDANDLSGHGTHIATILAGNGKYKDDNGETYQSEDYGIAPDAKIINIKVLDKTGYGKDEWLIDGFETAITGLEIPILNITVKPNLISASLTSITFARNLDPVEEQMFRASSEGIPVVASAGNYGPSGGSTGAPALWDNVISVGATEYLDKLAVFTSKGLNLDLSPGIDIVAPGIAIQGSDAGDGGSRWVSGTSVSAPIITGVLALLMEAHPGLNIHKYEAALLDTAVDLNFPVEYQGNGLVDPVAAFEFLNQFKDTDFFTILPKRISPENQYYYSCVEGDNTEFKLKIISTHNTTIFTTVTGAGAYAQIANYFDIYEGWNHISFNISIPMGISMRDISTSILFEELTGVNDTLSISIQTRYYGGTVLFDNSKENDTENAWFDSSTPYGTHMYLSRILKDRGFHIKNHIQGDYDFTGVDIFVISDPELNFTSQELTDIEAFVTGGGSLLFLVDSIRFIDAGAIEREPLISSNYFACDQVLNLFDLNIGDYSTYNYTPYVASTNNTSIFNTDSFMFWGRPIDAPLDNDSVVVATYKAVKSDEAVIDTDSLNAVIAKEFGNGRLMVFGSGYAFTDHGLLPDSYETNPARANLTTEYRNVFHLDNKNLQIANDTFSWLIEKYRPTINIYLTTSEINIRIPFKIGVRVYRTNGSSYLSPSGKLDATILDPKHNIIPIELTLNYTTGMYIADVTLESYGSHRIYVPLKLSGHTETDGLFVLFNNVPFWDVLPTIKLIGTWVVAFIIIAVVLIPVFRNRFKKEPPS